MSVAPSPLTSRDTALLLLAAGLTLAAYLRALPNGFIVNWDDHLYVTQNEALRDLSPGGILRLFTSLHFENYHPLTNLSNMIELHLFGMSPLPFHLINVLLHVANVAWVYLVIRALTGSRFAAFPVALWFGIHPMHVESVAWIAERKDVLYAFFYLAALYAYVRRARGAGRLPTVWILFLLACLSKSAAVTFPVAMLLVDRFTGRAPARALWLEKIPFFLLSLVFGTVALLSQSATGATALVPLYPWYDRFLISCYAFAWYMERFLLPTHLSILHAYPVKTAGWFPLSFYLAPFLLVAIALLAHRLRPIRRETAFGLLFFAAGLILVVQWIPVGRAIVSERYTYIPYIGLAFIPAVVASRLRDGSLRGPRWLLPCLTFAFVACSAWFFVATAARARDWKDGESLFGAAIAESPDNPILRYNRGYAREVGQDYDGALKDFTEAIRLQPCYAQAYSNRGGTRFLMQDPRGAIEDYTQAIECDPAGTDGYYNRGHVRESLGDSRGALADYTQAIEHRGESAHISYLARGNLRQAMQDYEGAIADYGESIRLQPAGRSAWLNRGNARLTLHDAAEALDDYLVAARLDPMHPEPFYTMGLARIELGRKDEACRDFRTAYGMGYAPAGEMLRRHCP